MPYFKTKDLGHIFNKFIAVSHSFDKAIDPMTTRLAGNPYVDADNTVKPFPTFFASKANETTGFQNSNA